MSMQYSGLTGFLYRISEWSMRLAYVNLLWISFTLVGLVLFGLFPATAAMFAVIRKWVMGERDVPVFKTFYQAYKAEFLKINLFGYILAIIGYVLFIDYQFFDSMENSSLHLLSYLFLTLLIFYGLFLLYVFPVFVHYDIKTFQLIKNVFLVAISNPFSTVMMIVGSLLVFFITFSFSGLFLFFSGSSLALLLMWSAYRAFIKIEHRLSKIVEQGH
ncbi:YesL family protein [Bacillus taeanensis]|uniref:DUF624 domain-containing protein n=1 Tax=Bacillus taeanensis TaxID=273032 RepID=A0A366Y1B4_9BACI|nr:YesL family protein [Bacillus taeanensis]RBW70789.1 hypothetical protein DS031_04755 [Bacillus taeanensis]